MNAEFNEWWNEDLLTEDNPFVDGTPAYWAWEGWCAAVKSERGSWPAEMEAMERQVNILTDALAESRREIDAMIALARADEREACAMVCEGFDFRFQDDSAGSLQDAASAIRKRGQE